LDLSQPYPLLLVFDGAAAPNSSVLFVFASVEFQIKIDWILEKKNCFGASCKSRAIYTDIRLTY